ncbi:MAG: hypothetical protein ACTHNW_07875 [Mucilaginibacter sp.]
MSYSHLLDLHLSQCEIFLARSKNNSYSDTSKKDYQEQLFSLFETIKASIKPGIDDSLIFEKQEHLNFIFKSLEFLKDSTLNSIPFEVVSCLNLAMNDWINRDEYIIVTSLNNNVGAYSYDPSLAFEDLLYSSLKANYNIDFKKRLVQINVPLMLSKDYFSSVVLYHELGHFIDLYYRITQLIAFDLITNCKPDEWSAYQAFLPFKQDMGFFAYTQWHLAEYFCDIFASQYIGYTSNYYLQYITKNSNSISATHPSTINRVKVVEDFLSGKDNLIVNIIQKYIKQITGKELKKRFADITEKDFYQFIPLAIDSSEQLHGVFSYAWEIWSAGKDNFKSLAKITSDLSSDRIYKILNNLIEKSIGNYFIKLDWELAIKK